MNFLITKQNVKEAEETVKSLKNIDERLAFIKEHIGDALFNFISSTSSFILYETNNRMLSIVTGLALYSIILPLWVANERTLPPISKDDFINAMDRFDMDIELPESWEEVANISLSRFIDISVPNIVLVTVFESLRLLYSSYKEIDDRITKKMEEMFGE